MPMIAITTKSSTSVNPFDRREMDTTVTPQSRIPHRGQEEQPSGLSTPDILTPSAAILEVLFQHRQNFAPLPHPGLCLVALRVHTQPDAGHT
jgi:hypothetical protein